MQPVLLGGVFIGVLTALPIINWCNCCCLWILAGGALAAYLQQQNQPTSLGTGGGARAGLLAGIVGAMVWLVVAQALAVVLSPLQQRMIGEVLRNARDLPPEVRSVLESAEAGRTGGFVWSFILMLVCGSLVAALGGAISAAYFRKDIPPALGGPMAPPPLP